MFNHWGFILVCVLHCRCNALRTCITATVYGTDHAMHLTCVLAHCNVPLGLPLEPSEPRSHLPVPKTAQPHSLQLLSSACLGKPKFEVQSTESTFTKKIRGNNPRQTVAAFEAEIPSRSSPVSSSCVKEASSDIFFSIAARRFAKRASSLACNQADKQTQSAGINGDNDKDDGDSRPFPSMNNSFVVS